MSDYRILKNAENGAVILPRVKWCESAWCRFRGLMFARNLPADEGLLFVGRKDSRTDTSIHMFFMFFQIGVVWIDSSGQVVDKKLAKPWRPAYVPKAPARYFVEANPDILERVQIGDILHFDETIN